MTRSVSRALVLGLVLVLACSHEAADDADALGEGSGGASSGVETSAGTTDSTSATDTSATITTDDQPCNVIECSMACGTEQSECGPLMFGNCIDGVCECTTLPECLPCLPETCSPYEDCHGDWTYGGECETACHYEFPPFTWDPDVGCVLMLPPDLPHEFLDWFLVEIGGVTVPRARSCEAPADAGAYVLDNDTLTLTSCPDACNSSSRVSCWPCGRSPASERATRPAACSSRSWSRPCAA